MLNERMRSPIFGIVVLAVALTVSAAVPTLWRLENQADFLLGDTDGVSIASDGTISLAPAAEVIGEATDPHFWSLAGDSDAIYVGSGNEGKVYRVDSSGETHAVMDSNELQVHALALDRLGNLYIGTSPRGSVYRMGSDRRQEPFFDSDDRYIWALAVDSSGNVIVATGDKAQVHRVRPSGESEVLFTSEETHIVSLALGRDDTIYAGTDSNGLVLQIDRSGQTSVLYDTPFQEVRALTIDTRGNVYAATVNGSATRTTPEASPSASGAGAQSPLAPTSPSGGGESITVTATATAVLAPSTGGVSSVSTSSAKGGLYRIATDGAAELLWQSPEDIPLALSLATDDRLMVGTGNEGRVYLVNQDKTSSLLLSVEAGQVTSILPPNGSATYLTTSNPAKVYRIEQGRRTEGIYRSQAKDAQTVSSWGKIRWEARSPGGTNVTLQTRTGNSAEPDNTWSAWSPPLMEATGEQISSPRGRFFQWRAILSSTGELSPELQNVTMVYLQQNLPPEVSEIAIQPPGHSFQKPIITAGQIEILGLNGSLSDDQQPGNGSSAQAGVAMNMTALARPLYRKGIQTVTWKGSDPNQDELIYDVHYRAEGESLWRSLRDGLENPVIAWDTSAMPDGRYTLRIVASDSPSNPSDIARTADRISRSFEVDNTPPRVTGLTVESTEAGHRVRFVAEDEISAVRNVAYAINSGSWSIVFPTDGIADSKRESFDVTLPGFGNGVYTLVVKVTDSLGNTRTARAELR